MKRVTLFCCLSIIIQFGCEEDKDVAPPLVSILEPLDFTVASEIVSIKCVADDNEAVEFVELWINNLSTGIMDSSEPYELLWNTVNYLDSTEYSIMVMAKDVNNNTGFSDSISIIVDNTGSHPTMVNIKSIDYTDSIMTIVFDMSLDSDFDNYKIFRSQDSDSTKTLIQEITNIMDTLIQINDFNPVEQFWYWIQVEDIYGYTTISESYYVLDQPPIGVVLSKIVFSDSLFQINWTPNSEFDFFSYSVFESINPDMSNKIKIFETNDNNITSFEHNQIELSKYRYYQIIVTDYWGLQTASNIEVGCSWYLFNDFYGDASYDFGRVVIQADDGGYIVAGNSSLLGDEYSNALIIKMNHLGQQQWIKNYTFSATDRINSISLLDDGSFIMTGFITNSSKDVLLLKLDSYGNIDWYESFSTEYDEIGNSVDITPEGNFIITGEAFDETGYSDLLLMQFDGSGEMIFMKKFGGVEEELGLTNRNDYGYSVLCTDDNAFIMTGITRSNGDSDGDVWLIKTNLNGDTLWTNTFGWNETTEAGRSIKNTNDSGYIITGHTNSFGSGNNDAYLLKVDTDGNEIWSKAFGGTGTDHGRNVVQTADQGYLISGYTDSFDDTGGFDFWLIKTAPDGDLDWQKTYGGNSDDKGLWAVETLDGGYIITGYSNSNSNNIPDVLLIKTDNIGNTSQ